MASKHQAATDRGTNRLQIEFIKKATTGIHPLIQSAASKNQNTGAGPAWRALNSQETIRIQAALALELATAASMNAMPRTPSSMVG